MSEQETFTAVRLIAPPAFPPFTEQREMCLAQLLYGHFRQHKITVGQEYPLWDDYSDQEAFRELARCAVVGVGVGVMCGGRAEKITQAKGRG